MTLPVVQAHLGALLVAMGSSIAVWLAVARGWGFHSLLRYEARLASDLDFVGGPPPRVVAIGQGAALAAILGATFWWRAATPLALAVPCVVGPHFALLHARSSRTRAIEAQLDTWLTSLSNTLVATASLGEALMSSARLLQSPLREEVERMTAHMRLGTPLDRALATFGRRVRSPVVSGAILSLRVARNSGGELRPMLESAASALRDMARFEGMVRAKTSEGKAQALAVSVVPAPLVLSIHAMSPEFFAPLARSATGTLVIAGAVFLWIAAIALAAKITAVDV